MKKASKKVSKKAVKKTTKTSKQLGLKLGRPRQYAKKKVLSISLDTSLYKDLKKMAQGHELTTSKMVQGLIVNALQIRHFADMNLEPINKMPC